MIETSQDSKPQIHAMNPTSAESIVALPNLSEAKAPISLTLTIDKSVGKVAAWVIGLVAGMGILLGVGIAMSVWMTVEYQRSEREARMLQYYLLELDAKVIAAGIKKPEDAISKKLDKGGQ